MPAQTSSVSDYSPTVDPQASPSAMQQGAVLNGEKIRDLYFEAVNSIRPELHEYWLNHAFIQGQQWLWFNPETRRLDELPRDPDRVQATINIMKPAVRRLVAKATERELTFQVPPSAADDSSTRGSRIAEAVLTDTHDRQDWENERELVVWATLKGGTAALMVDWDPKGNDIVGQDPVSGRQFGTGEAVLDVLSLAQFVVQPGAPDAERALWWIVARTLPPAQVQDELGLDHLPPADATAGMTPFQAKLVAGGSKSSGQRPELTLVLTYYERPNVLRPKGMVATVVDSKIVGKAKPWHFPFTDHLNFALVRETKDENKWTGDTVVSDARFVQTAYNASWSSIIEHMKLAGNARLYVPQSAVDIIEQLSDLPGEIVPYPDGQALPQFASPPQMPQWWIEEPLQLKEQLDDILGGHDVSRGNAPKNIESGLGLAILDENDNTPLARLVKETAIAFGKVATMTLQMYAKFVGNTREAQVSNAAEGLPPTVEKWTGKSLAGQTRARVPLDAVMPRNRAAVQAFAERLLQQGAITLTQFARLAELADRKDIIDLVAPDVARARRENHRMANWQPGDPEVVVEPFDDDSIHLQELNNFRKSVAYELLSQPQKDHFELHARAHETQAAEKAGRAVNQAMHNPALAASPNADGSPTLDPALMPQPGGAPAPAPAGGAPEAQGAAGSPSPAGAPDQLSAPGGTPGPATPPQ